MRSSKIARCAVFVCRKFTRKQTRAFISLHFLQATEQTLPRKMMENLILRCQLLVLCLGMRHSQTVHNRNYLWAVICKLIICFFKSNCFLVKYVQYRKSTIVNHGEKQQKVQWRVGCTCEGHDWWRQSHFIRGRSQHPEHFILEWCQHFA